MVMNSQILALVVEIPALELASYNREHERLSRTS